MNIESNTDIVKEVEERIYELSRQPNFTTAEVRSVSAGVFRLIKDKSIDNVLGLCEELLEKRTWALGVVAYDWAFRMKKQYKKGTFHIFERWLKKYVSGWGDCDDFCTHAFGELISQHNELFHKVMKWTNHRKFWVRRAAAVILIYPIKKGRFDGLDPLAVADKLINDKHNLVLKGYGWMLKEYSVPKSDEVFKYLMSNKHIMPRVSFRYAAEKFDKDKKIILMET